MRTNFYGLLKKEVAMHEDGLKESTPKVGGQVGRREFLKIAMGAGLAMAVDPFSPPLASGAVKPTGTLTVAIPAIGNPVYVPALINPDAMTIANGSFGESLLSRNKDMSLAPMLAQSWSASPDGKVLTFDLRKGIKFHDGSELTSADVKFTIEGAISPNSINADAALWRNAVDHIETPTPQRAVIYLKKRNIAIPYRAAHP
ncbi:MAG: ABC transporter substrate-binding protein, partial [bacterium]